MKGAVRGAVQAIKPKTVMAATQLDECFSYQTYLGTMPIFAKLGVKALPTVESQGAIDPVAIVANIKKSNPDIVFLPLIARDATKVLLEMKKQNVSKPVVCNCGFLLGDVAIDVRAAAELVFFSVPWAKDASDAFNVDFLQAYRGAYKSEPSSQAALAYEGVYLAANSLKKIKNLGFAREQIQATRESLSREMAGGKHDGVAGSYRFIKAGSGYDAERRGYSYQYRSGQIDKINFPWFSNFF